MSRNRASRREIIALDKVPRSWTPEPAPKRPRTKRSSYSRHSSGSPSAKRASRDLSDRAATDLALERDASLDQDPQATIASPVQGRMLRLDQDPQATNASAEQDRIHPLDPARGHMLRLDQDPQATNASPELEEPEEGPGEAAVGGE